MPCADCRYAECRVILTIMLSVIMLNVVMLSVVMLNVVLLSVVSPGRSLTLSGASDLHTNIGLGWKDFQGTNTLAYYEHL